MSFVATVLWVMSFRLVSQHHTFPFVTECVNTFLVSPDIRKVPRGLHQGQGEQDCRRQPDADGHPVPLVDGRLDDAGLLSLAVVLFGRLHDLARVF